LDDFMDYLVYVEHNAENLQFYLWYQDYVHRWNALSENERNLSPRWLSDQDVPGLKRERVSRREGSLPSPPISPYAKSRLLPGGWDANGISFFDDSDAQSLGPDTPSMTTFFRGSLVPNNTEAFAQAALKWQPCTLFPLPKTSNPS
jgi:hypothetical protein